MKVNKHQEIDFLYITLHIHVKYIQPNFISIVHIVFKQLLDNYESDHLRFG